MSTVLLRPHGANPDVRSMEAAAPAAVEEGGAGRGDAPCEVAGAAHARVNSPPGIAMKISLEHLPHRKQVQLADVTATICAMAPVEMVILFGSHARGDWVDDPVGIHTGDTWEDDPSGGLPFGFRHPGHRQESPDRREELHLGRHRGSAPQTARQHGAEPHRS